MIEEDLISGPYNSENREKLHKDRRRESKY